MQLPHFLVQDPHGSIRLTGHRIGLEHLVYCYNQGSSPETLVDQFPTLSLALIHKVIGFYLENQAEVDAYVARCQSEIEQQRAAAPASPDLVELRRRMEQLSKLSAP